MSNGNFGAVTDKSVKLRCDVDVESDTAMGAWAIFDPTGMDAIVRFEFAPIRHGCSFEAPSTGFAAEVALFDIAAAVSKSVAVGAVVVIFFENAE